MESPIRVGTLVRTVEHVNLMRGTPKENSGVTVLVEPEEVLLIADVHFVAKNPHTRWWYVQLMHIGALYWRLMDTESIHKTFVKMDSVSLDLHDRMLDEDDIIGDEFH